MAAIVTFIDSGSIHGPLFCRILSDNLISSDIIRNVCHLSIFHSCTAGEEACYERWRSGVQAMFVNRDPKSRGSILSPDSSHVAVIHSCDFKDDVPHHWGIW